MLFRVHISIGEIHICIGVKESPYKDKRKKVVQPEIAVIAMMVRPKLIHGCGGI